jgi:hypothetical protein
MGGDCGGAHVVIKDARQSFVRWLKKEGLGHRHCKSGYTVSARQIDQSAEAAKAYADAFARALRRNGIDCRSAIYYT